MIWTPGALVAIWCTKRGWNKVEQRAVFQPYILMMQLAAFAALAWLAPGHGMDPSIVGYALPALGGAVIGLRVFRTLTDAQFQRLIHVALIASGGALLFK